MKYIASQNNLERICFHFHRVYIPIAEPEIINYPPNQLQWILINSGDITREQFVYIHKENDICKISYSDIYYCRCCGKLFTSSARDSMDNLFKYIGEKIEQTCIENQTYDYCSFDNENWKAKHLAYLIRWNYLQNKYPNYDFLSDNYYLSLCREIGPTLYRDYNEKIEIDSISITELHEKYHLSPYL